MALRSGGQEFAYVGGVLETFVISGIYEYRMIINAKAGGNLNLGCLQCGNACLALSPSLWYA